MTIEGEHLVFWGWKNFFKFFFSKFFPTFLSISKSTADSADILTCIIYWKKELSPFIYFFQHFSIYFFSTVLHNLKYIMKSIGLDHARGLSQLGNVGHKMLHFGAWSKWINESIWHEFPNFLFLKNCHCTADIYRVFSFHEQMQCDTSYCVWKRSRHCKLSTDGVSFPRELLQHEISFFVFWQS